MATNTREERAKETTNEIQIAKLRTNELEVLEMHGKEDYESALDLLAEN